MEEQNDFYIKPSSTKKVLKNYNKNGNESSNSAVPDFIQKLFRMLENKAFKDVFCWNPSGTTFLVKDTNEFSKSILPKHFKHCNFASFVRQLNKYDFHKIRTNPDESQKLYGDQIWEFEHSHFQRDRKDLLEEIKRKTPGKKKKTNHSLTDTTTFDKQTPSPIISQNDIKSPSLMTAESSSRSSSSTVVEELRKLTRELQSQVNELKQSHVELEATLQQMEKTDNLIMTELSGFQHSLKRKDELIKECMDLTIRSNPQQQSEKVSASSVAIEELKNLPVVSGTTTTTTGNSATWSDQSTIPIESILTDLFLPTPTAAAGTSSQPSSSSAAAAPIDTATVAAAAAQLNGGSLIGSSIKTSDGGLAFLALGRLGSNNNTTPAAVKIENHNDNSNSIMKVSNQTDHVPASETDKGKKKMVASWTTPPRVLLVDDDSVYRDVSGRMLNMIGCSIDLAKDGLEALQKMSAEKYDLILMDIVMPKMDGIVTTRNIRRYDSLTPIVSMTSNFTHNDIMEYIGIGMNDILPKPFSKNTLYDILEKHCAHLKIIQQQQSNTSSSSNEAAMIPRGLSLPVPMLEEAPSNNNTNYSSYTTTPNNNTAIIVDTPSTSSTTSSPTNHSPTTTTHPNTDSNGYWQPIDNRKLVWSSSSSSTPSSVQQQQQKYHHPLPLHHHHPLNQQHHPSKRQKLNDLYDPPPPPPPF